MKDFALLDTKAAAETGAVIFLDDPFSGEPLLDDDGVPLSITVLGADSEKVGKAIRANADKRIARIQKRGSVEDAWSETQRADTISTLAKATVAWHILPVDGVVLECTEANARKFYGDPRFPWVVEQLDKAVVDRKRFFKNSSAS